MRLKQDDGQAYRDVYSRLSSLLREVTTWCMQAAVVRAFDKTQIFWRASERFEDIRALRDRLQCGKQGVDWYPRTYLEWPGVVAPRELFSHHEYQNMEANFQRREFWTCMGLDDTFNCGPLLTYPRADEIAKALTNSLVGDEPIRPLENWIVDLCIANPFLNIRPEARPAMIPDKSVSDAYHELIRSLDT